MYKKIHYKVFIFSLFIIFALFLHSRFKTPSQIHADESGFIIDHTNIDLSDSLIPQSYLDIARDQKIFFGHQSVGNVVTYDDGGLQYLSNNYDRYRLNIQHDPTSSWYANNNGFGDSHIGENYKPSLKVDDFKSKISTFSSNLDIAMMKFCYVDFDTLGNGGSTPAQIFEKYKSEMQALEISYPNIKFVWWTAPLTYVNDPSGSYGTNEDRLTYNTLVRNFAQENNKILFDVADIESRHADGTACMDNGYPALCSEYNGGTGHPNSVGARRLSRAIWWLLARVVGWDGISTTTPTSTSVPTLTPTPSSSGSVTFFEQNGLLVVEAEHYNSNIGQSGHQWTTESVISNYSGSGYVSSLPNDGTSIYSTGYESTSPKLTYSVNFTNTGRYYIWIRSRNDSTFDDSIHIGVNNSGLRTMALKYNTLNWLWSKSLQSGSETSYIDITTPGTYDFNLWMREDGSRIDKIVFTNNSGYTPSGTGPVESSSSGTVLVPTSTSTPTLTLTPTPTMTSTPTPTPVSNNGNIFQESNGVLVIEAEHYNSNVGFSGHLWTDESNINSYSGSGYISSLPNNGLSIQTTLSPVVSYPVNFTNTGTYYIWVRSRNDSGVDDSIHLGFNGAIQKTMSLGSSTSNWIWGRYLQTGGFATIIINTPGTYNLNMWMREDGSRIDKIIFTTNSSYYPTGTGPSESTRN